MLVLITDKPREAFIRRFKRGRCALSPWGQIAPGATMGMLNPSLGAGKLPPNPFFGVQQGHACRRGAHLVCYCCLSAQRVPPRPCWEHLGLQTPQSRAPVRSHRAGSRSCSPLWHLLPRAGCSLEARHGKEQKAAGEGEGDTGIPPPSIWLPLLISLQGAGRATGGDSVAA